ncbi:MAG: hypothetical protein AB8F95_03445 [Bacteroidia bacterium]
MDYVKKVAQLIYWAPLTGLLSGGFYEFVVSIPDVGGGTDSLLGPMPSLVEMILLGGMPYGFFISLSAIYFVHQGPETLSRFTWINIAGYLMSIIFWIAIPILLQHPHIWMGYVIAPLLISISTASILRPFTPKNRFLWILLGQLLASSVVCALYKYSDPSEDEYSHYFGLWQCLSTIALAPLVIRKT